ncbi:MAG: ABC transporter permease [Planctomycetaceae bacterium]|nr:ABC transporter permease [Planctomycetaceae bacterium]
MNGLLRLAWKHARFHRLRSLLLVLSLGIGFSIPLATRWMTADLQQMLSARAESTPLLMGSPGSRVDLALTALYFHNQEQQIIPYKFYDEFTQSELVNSIPLHLQHSAQSYPIVGTTLDYFSKRNLSLQSGTMPRRLGDCLLGENVATQVNLHPGDQLLSDAKGFLNPVGDLPLKMRVTGILVASDSPDDQAVFVDIKTAWLMDGIAHGHLGQLQASQEQILQQDEEAVTFGKNVLNYMEVTDENLSSFHFHGNQSTFPLTAILIYPLGEREGILWEGRHQNRTDLLVVEPLKVIQELISLLINIRQVIDTVVLALGIVMLILLLLLGGLSLQLRKTEMETFHAMGASRLIRVQLIGLDFLLLFAASVPVAILLSWLTASVGKPLLFQLLI